MPSRGEAPNRASKWDCSIPQQTKPDPASWAKQPAASQPGTYICSCGRQNLPGNTPTGLFPCADIAAAARSHVRSTAAAMGSVDHRIRLDRRDDREVPVIRHLLTTNPGQREISRVRDQCVANVLRRQQVTYDSCSAVARIHLTRRCQSPSSRSTYRRRGWTQCHWWRRCGYSSQRIFAGRDRAQ